VFGTPKVRARASASHHLDLVVVAVQPEKIDPTPSPLLWIQYPIATTVHTG
jgi:hypothetical protein